MTRVLNAQRIDVDVEIPEIFDVSKHAYKIIKYSFEHEKVETGNMSVGATSMFMYICV